MRRATPRRAPEDDRPIRPEPEITRRSHHGHPTDAGERASAHLLDAARRIDPSTDRRAGPVRAETNAACGVVRPRVRARLGLARASCSGSASKRVTQTGSTAAAVIMVVHVALAAAGVGGGDAACARRRRSAAARGPRGRAETGPSSGSGHRGAQALQRARTHARVGAAASHAGGDGDVPSPLVQPGLFDRRALHEAARQQSAREHRAAIARPRVWQRSRSGRARRRCCA